MSFLRKKIKALSLIEVSIVLIIIGIITAGALQGWKYITGTKITATINQIIQIQSAAQLYKNNNHQLPTENFWKIIEDYGGPTITTTDNQQTVHSAIGPAFEKQQNNTITLGPIKPQYAQQIKKSIAGVDITSNHDDNTLTIHI